MPALHTGHHRITVLQYNTHLFGGISPLKLRAMSLAATVVHEDEARLAALSDALVALGADIVCLEEVWSDVYKEHLSQKLRHFYPHAFHSPFPEEFALRKKQLGSGLLLLSRHRIASPAFAAFGSLTGSDAWSEKGLISAEIQVERPDGLYPVHLLFTHTQAGDGDAAAGARAGNINDIGGALTRQVRSAARDSALRPRLLIGDLNVVAEDKDGEPTAEYSLMRREFHGGGFEDLALALYPDRRRDPLYTSDPLNNRLIPIFDPNDRSRSRLDYVFVANTVAAECSLEVPTGWLYDSPSGNGRMDISDHYPMVVSVPLTLPQTVRA